MLKRLSLLVITQFILSVACALLIKQMSFIGKISIHLFYKDYLLFRNPLQSTLTLFIVQVLLIVLLLLIRTLLIRNLALLSYGLITIGICIGLYFTIQDFTTTSHKYMKFRFHAGIYLFWISSLLSVFLFYRYSYKKQTEKASCINSFSKTPLN